LAGGVTGGVLAPGSAAATVVSRLVRASAAAFRRAISGVGSKVCGGAAEILASRSARAFLRSVPILAMADSTVPIALSRSVVVGSVDMMISCWLIICSFWWLR